MRRGFAFRLGRLSCGTLGVQPTVERMWRDGVQRAGRGNTDADHRRADVYAAADQAGEQDQVFRSGRRRLSGVGEASRRDGLNQIKRARGVVDQSGASLVDLGDGVLA